MTDRPTIMIRHAASTLHNLKLGTTKFKNTHPLKDVAHFSFQDVPSTHLAYHSSGKSQYYSDDRSWQDVNANDDEKMARHPSNLKAVWGIDQVKDPQATYESLNLKLLPPGLAEFPGFQCPGQPGTPLYGTNFTPEADGCLRLNVCHGHKDRPGHCPLSDHFVSRSRSSVSLATTPVKLRIIMLTKNYAKVGISGPIYATTLDWTFILPSQIDRLEVANVADFTKGGNLLDQWRTEIQARLGRREKRKDNKAVKNARKTSNSASKSQSREVPTELDDMDEGNSPLLSSEDEGSLYEIDTDNDNPILITSTITRTATASTAGTKRSREESYTRHGLSPDIILAPQSKGKGKEKIQEKGKVVVKDTKQGPKGRYSGYQFVGSQEMDERPMTSKPLRQPHASGSNSDGRGSSVFVAMCDAESLNEVVRGLKEGSKSRQSGSQYLWTRPLDTIEPEPDFTTTRRPTLNDSRRSIKQATPANVPRPRLRVKEEELDE